MPYNSIAIAGAGIAGLAAAAALAGIGKSVAVYEQTPVFSEVGAGLQLGPNAVRALQAIGCWDEVSAVVSAPPEIHIRNGTTGKLLRRVKLGTSFVDRFGFPYFVAHRADLHGALLRCAAAFPNVVIEKHVRVDTACDTASGVRISSGSGDTIEYDALIAADGINSILRTTIFPNTTAISLPFVAYRSLLSEVPTGQSLAMDCVNLWMMPKGHVVHYPVGPKPMFNIVAATPGPAVEAAFTSASSILRDILALPQNWLEWPLRYVPPLPQWCRGHICLIGDAAHGTVPFLAQGAAMALEDVAALQDLVHNGRPLTALADARQQRVTRLDSQSRAMSKIYHAGLPASLVRDTVLRLGPAALIDSAVDWIYQE
jgi:salicylate hydroxylase